MELDKHSSMASFVLAIRDWEERYGICRYPAEGMPQQAVNLGYTRTKDLQPAAVYSIPGEKDYALVVLDHFTGAPRLLARIKPTDCSPQSSLLLH